MKRKIKVFLAAIMVCAMLVGTFSGTFVPALKTSAAGKTLLRGELSDGTGSWSFYNNGELVLRSNITVDKKGTAPWNEFISSISSVSIMNNVTAIDDYSFASSVIKSIYIPKAISKLSRKAFDGCNKLTDIWYEGTEAEWIALNTEIDGILVHFVHEHTAGNPIGVEAGDCTTPSKTGDVYCTECKTLISETADGALGHVWSAVRSLKTAATCKDPQNIYDYKCTVCGEWKGDEKAETVAAPEHTYVVTSKSETECNPNGVYYTETCSVCGNTRTLLSKAHVFTTETVAPTCENAGYTQTVCKYCTAAKDDRVELPKRGHDFSVHGHTDATHTQAGEDWYVCSVCGIKGESKIIPSFHDASVAYAKANGKADENSVFYGADKSVYAKNSTCIKNGCEVLYCTICEKEAAEGQGAVSGIAVSEPLKDKDGNLVTRDLELDVDKVYINEYGSEFLKYYDKDKNEYISEKTDSEGWIIKEPTCTTDGYRVKKCETCGKIKAQETIPALGHDYKPDDNQEASYCINVDSVNGGTSNYTCRRCGTKKQEKCIKAASHAFVYTAKAPTCTENGYMIQTCSNPGCPYYDEYDFTAALGHDIKKGVIVKAPTCTEEGAMCDVCQRDGCGYTENETVIPANGHNYVEVIVKEATCTEEGRKRNICTVCGDVKEDNDEYIVIPKTSHENSTEVVEPTCTTVGYTKHTCNKCGNVYKDTFVAALGHSWGDVVNVNPTCTEDGYTQHTCAVCGTTEIIKVFANTATGHDFSKTIEKLDPTCLQDGHTAGLVCSVCGQFSTETMILPALGHDYQISYVWSNDGSSCQAISKCSHDATHKKSEDGTVTHSIKTDSTCLSKGTTIYTASFLDTGLEKQTIEIQDIAKKPHTYTTWQPYEAATCEKPATEISYCDVCHSTALSDAKIRNDLSKPALGHNYSVEYLWSADGKTCTAVATCQNDASHVENETENGTGVQKSAPSCTSDGVTAYTASFSNSLFMTQTIEKIDIPALGHSAVPSDTVAATCTVNGHTGGTVCERCGVTLDQGTVIPATGHNWNNGTIVEEAKVFSSGTKEYVCQTCGEKKTESYSLTFPQKIQRIFKLIFGMFG